MATTQNSIFPLEFFKDDQFSMPSNTGTEFFFIGELAKMLKLNPKAIRFYEKEGLIKPSRHGSFRTFLQSDIDRLKSIISMRRIGLSIAILKALYGLKDFEKAKHFMLASLKDHLNQLEKQKIILEEQLNETSVFLERLERHEQSRFA
jgi:DNA-binding transcriptional MerR regulator